MAAGILTRPTISPSVTAPFDALWFRSRRCISGSMAWGDLPEEERAEVARLLRQATDGDRYPLSPRVRWWRVMLATIGPPVARPTPFPAPRPSAEPGFSLSQDEGREAR